MSGDQSGFFYAKTATAKWGKTILFDTIGLEVEMMKNKSQISHQVVLTEKPPKAKVSDAEFRRRLKKIDQWREKRLAEIRAENPS